MCLMYGWIRLLIYVMDSLEKRYRSNKNTWGYDKKSTRGLNIFSRRKFNSLRINTAAEKHVTQANSENISSWWNKYLPTSYLSWPRKTRPGGLRQRKHDTRGGACDHNIDGDLSDYRTPPPSPTPPSSQLISPFRFFMHSWNVEVLPEHYEICFNFLRHLFDLFVVGFLWTVSPPAKLILEVLGVQGTMRLWFHGMAMFFVSTVGMAGLLWLIQEYLPQFALIYGVVQALVISVSIRQSVMLNTEEEKEGKDKEGKETDEKTE
uniref:Uncharacterized protein n=1 Tax=Monopterus albus TaxID=43700 RepID=A0A3Q3K4C4_MONAL